MMPRAIHILDVEASRAVDRAASTQYGIPSLLLMENAARGVVTAVQRHFPDAQRAIIVCGSGNNGGDGYAVARLLHIRGWHVEVIAISPPRLDSDAATNEAILRRMNIPIHQNLDAETSRDVDVIVDAMFGTGLDRDITGDPAHLLAIMDDLPIPVLSIDIPSGLDATHGRPLGVAVHAACTVTFVGPKPGLLTASAMPYVGTLYIADIGAPMELAAEFGQPLDDFPSTDDFPQIEWID